MSEQDLEIFNECFEDLTEEEQKNTMQFVHAYNNAFKDSLKDINRARKLKGFSSLRTLGDESIKELIVAMIRKGYL